METILEKLKPVEAKAETKITTSDKLVQFVKKASDNYKAPTPLPWRKIGNALDDLSKIAAGISLFTSNPYISAGILLLGWVGRQLTNFATK